MTNKIFVNLILRKKKLQRNCNSPVKNEETKYLLIIFSKTTLFNLFSKITKITNYIVRVDVKDIDHPIPLCGISFVFCIDT